MSSQERRFVHIDPSLLAAKNVIVVAPTGSGKTHATLNAVLRLVPSRYRRAVILAPTKALMWEIYEKAKRLLRQAYGAYGEKMVGIDNSDAKLDMSWRFSEEWSKPIVVTSYERFDAIISRDPDFMRNSIIVLDEAHNMLQPQRATPILNILATAKYLSEQGGDVRIVLLSATMPEVEGLSKYLDAEVVQHGERPVELEVKREKVNVYGRGSRIYYLTKFPKIAEYAKKMPKPILVYVPSRALSEQIAKWLEKEGLRAVPFHAGMPFDKRREIQQELSKPNPRIDVVVATDTLTQGVNLSFRTVIIPGLKRFMKGGVEYVDPATIRQVMGRAGRPQYGFNKGYVVIIETPDEAPVVDDALKGVYGEISEPGDYPGLVLRLAATGRNPELWARYAYKVNTAKMLEAADALRSIGVLGENGEPTKLGYVLAREYATGLTIPVFKLIESIESNKLFEGHPVEKLMLYALLASYYATRAWTRANSITSKMMLSETPVQSITDILDPRKLNNILYEKYGADLDLEAEQHPLYNLWRITSLVDSNAPTDFTLPEWYADLMVNPALMNIDNELEALRKQLDTLHALATAGVISPEYAKPAYLLMQLTRAYRALLRRINPEDAAKLYKAMLIAAKRLVDNGTLNAIPDRVYRRAIERAVSDLLTLAESYALAHYSKGRKLGDPYSEAEWVTKELEERIVRYASQLTARRQQGVTTGQGGSRVRQTGR